MNDTITREIPEVIPALLAKCEEIGFSMPSDLYIGSLLKTLIASKPNARFLELGTGIGLSLAWMIAGMDERSTIVSIDNDQDLVDLVIPFFEKDSRVEILCTDGGQWLRDYKGAGFDLIFADAWPGKFYDLDETFQLLNPGGFYVIDDMRPADDWPEGHYEKVEALWKYYENRSDFVITKMDWSTGIMIGVKV